MTLKNNRAPHLIYFKLCASFHGYRSIQTGVTVRKHQIWVKISDFLSLVTLKCDEWPQKTIGHLSYATSSFVYHFIAICEFKPELQSENSQVWFWPLWPWPLTSDLELWHGHHLCQWYRRTDGWPEPFIELLGPSEKHRHICGVSFVSLKYGMGYLDHSGYELSQWVSITMNDPWYYTLAVAALHPISCYNWSCRNAEIYLMGSYHHATHLGHDCLIYHPN